MSDTTTGAAESVREKADAAVDAVLEQGSDAGAAVKDAAAATKDAGKDAAAATKKAAAATQDKAVAAVDTAKAAVPSADVAAPEKPPVRSPREIEDELDATRERLVARIDELQSYVSPKNVLDRQVAKVKGIFVDEYGGVRPDRVLMVAGAVVLVVGLGVVRRRRRG